MHTYRQYGNVVSYYGIIRIHESKIFPIDYILKSYKPFKNILTKDPGWLQPHM